MKTTNSFLFSKLYLQYFHECDIIFSGKILEMFQASFVVEVKKIINKSRTKSLDFDPVSTQLKKYVNKDMPLYIGQWLN